ncbi:hypothetical protein [Cytobacillus kochii]|uniref:hypothetical protein n=1 Tax=Cytobacillus kochii TaxID=859143 RepID=UPI00248056BB|nr:hypothetical protein [Cytobacillus kochii]
MLFSGGLLLAAGTTLLVATADSALESYGYGWLGTFLRIALPVAGLITGVYFIEHNALIGWLR